MARSFGRRLARRAAWQFFPDHMERRCAVPFFPRIKQSGVAFIHIPKAAGMSLSEAIYGAQVGHLKWHHVHVSNPRVYDSLVKFAVCRHPIERFLSAFQFLKDGGINRFDQEFSDEVLRGFDSADDFACALEDPLLRARVEKKVHFHSQCSFVCDRGGQIMLDHLIAIERISQDVPKILRPDQVGDIPHNNRTASGPAASPELSPKAIEVLEEIYRPDFSLMQHVLGAECVRGRVVEGVQA